MCRSTARRSSQFLRDAAIAAALLGSAGCSGGGGSAALPAAVGAPVFAGSSGSLAATTATGGQPSATAAPAAAGAAVVPVLPVIVPTAPPMRTATAADAFVGTIGMNFNLASTQPARYQSVKSLFGQLGVRHVRESGENVEAKPQVAADANDLHASYGTTFDLLTSFYMTPADVKTAIAALTPGSVDFVEGPNESDNQGQGRYYDPQFASQTKPYMTGLYAAIKSDAATRSIGVIAPSFINFGSYAKIGDISSVADAGNMHDYLAGFSPGNGGYGGSTPPIAVCCYGSLPWNIAVAQQSTASKPVISTETGYSTAGSNGVPEAIKARYLPRLFLTSAELGVPRTYYYELVGENDATEDGSLGLVGPGLAPTPAYHELEGMISILSDSSRGAQPAQVPFALSGDTQNVHADLMRKADGTLAVPVWIERPSWDVNANGHTGGPIAVAPQSVTLSFAPGITLAKVWTADANGLWSSAPATVSAGSVTISATDGVAIVVAGTAGSLSPLLQRGARRI